MSSESLPITPARFAAALSDLPLASLRLKALELRNSLAHLAYSNAQLRPFADGLRPGPDGAVSQGEPDPDCADAIRENELVMARMRERVLLVRAEVERRGVGWREFEGRGGAGDDDGGDGGDEEEEEEEEPGATAAGGGPLTNGRAGDDGSADASTSPSGPTTTTTTTTTAATSRTAPARGNPWTDGTFQTGVIRNGDVHMDAVPGQRGGGAGAGDRTTAATATATATTRAGSAGGGRLTDEELRRMLEERLAEDGGDEEDGGLHL